MRERKTTVSLKEQGIGAGAGIPMIQWSAASDAGVERGSNEDSLFLFQSAVFHEGIYLPIGLAVIADGLGGYEKGELASELAANVVGDRVIRGCILPLLTGEEPRPINDVLLEAVSIANRSVIEAAAGRSMATTLTAALVLGAVVYLIHVGDCRAYVITKAGMSRITQDHTVLQRLLDLGQLSPDQARRHPELGTLYKALGRQQHVEPDALRHTLSEGARLLLCSDGVWEMLEDQQIADIVNASPNPFLACDRLIEAANLAGGVDNVTAIVGDLSSCRVD